jgi:hypothetical protein
MFADQFGSILGVYTSVKKPNFRSTTNTVGSGIGTLNLALNSKCRRANNAPVSLADAESIEIDRMVDRPSPPFRSSVHRGPARPRWLVPRLLDDRLLIIVSQIDLVEKTYLENSHEGFIDDIASKDQN